MTLRMSDDMTKEFVFTSSAQAFGDGNHPTTAGMLAALESIDPTAFFPRSACDMGCGSGILTLAMLSLFDCPVVAVDISSQAIETVLKNAIHNNYNHRVKAKQANGFSHPEIAAAAPFDLIVMNILADPLLALASEANRHLAAEGVLIISGLLQWQETQIREAYQHLGLELASRLTLGDWVTLVWQKP